MKIATLLGHQHIAVLNGRHLAHGIDRQIGRVALLADVHVENVQLVGNAELLEQREGTARARVGRMEKRDVRRRIHCSVPSLSRMEALRERD